MINANSNALGDNSDVNGNPVEDDDDVDQVFEPQEKTSDYSDQTPKIPFRRKITFMGKNKKVSL